MAKSCVDYAHSVIVSKTYDYEGNPVTFNKGDSLLVNATEMARPFGKEAKHWLINQSTKDFISELANVRNLTFADLVQVKQGSPENGGGTWLHEDVAMEFARWLSPKFAIWCNDRIKELLIDGKTAIKPLTPAEQLLANAQLLVDIERRQAEHERQQMMLTARQDATDNKIERIETRIRDNGFMAVMGFANIYHLKLGNNMLKKLGKQCSAWCKRMDILPEKTRHDKWGSVNTYPMQALRDVFKANFPDKTAMFEVPTYWG